MAILELQDLEVEFETDEAAFKSASSKDCASNISLLLC